MLTYPLASKSADEVAFEYSYENTARRLPLLDSYVYHENSTCPASRRINIHLTTFDGDPVRKGCIARIEPSDNDAVTVRDVMDELVGVLNDRIVFGEDLTEEDMAQIEGGLETARTEDPAAQNAEAAGEEHCWLRVWHILAGSDGGVDICVGFRRSAEASPGGSLVI